MNKRGRERGREECQAVLGGEHESLQTSQKLLAIFKMGTLIIVSVGF